MSIFLTILLPLLYFILITAFFYAIFNISKNSNLQTRLLRQVLEELRNQRLDKTLNKKDE